MAKEFKGKYEKVCLQINFKKTEFLPITEDDVKNLEIEENVEI